MTSKRFLSPFVQNIWQTVAVLILFSISFILYVQSEKRIDHANEIRLNSFVLADELRQSSDDLTRMIRTYVLTENPIYRQYYQEILDIRNGQRARPIDYQNIYWDLVSIDDKRPRPYSNQSIALIDKMRHAGFTESELDKLIEAKNNSDALTQTEFAAMKLIESKGSATAMYQQKKKALEILHDEMYHKAKSSIMRPIDEFYVLMQKRTNDAVEKAKSIAFYFRILFIFTGIYLLFTLWRLYKRLNEILGSSIDDVHSHITRIGKGDFSAPIIIKKGMEESVLGWLSETQHQLKQTISNNERLQQLYAALSQCNQAIVRSKNEEELFPIICRDAVNFGGMKMASIGMVDEQSGHINIVAFYGEGTDYLKNIYLSLKRSDPLGNGPSGRAYHEKQSIWCQDFLHDPMTAPWHKLGKTFGWGSAAAIPFYRDNHLVGVFNLYAAEANAFDDAAKKLLEEMAIDISYALDSFKRDKAREEMELALEAEKETAQNYLDIVGVMIMVLDINNNVQLINRRGCEIIGYLAEEVIGKNWIDTFLPEQSRHHAYEVSTSLIELQESILSFENLVLTKNGEERMIAWSNTTLFDPNGNIVGILTSGEDITARRLAEERSRYLANYDALTGLPNRAYLDDHLKYSLNLAKRNNENLVVMFLDLDHFKDINDTLGHNVGDKLLIESSERLQSSLREGDTVVRLGGDEFIILLPTLWMNGADRVAQKLIEVMKKPFKFDSIELNLTASIGIALYPEDGDDFETLYKNADTAMYRAKQDGRNRYCFFTKEMQAHSIRNLELGNALRHALDRNELELYYQPQISSKDSKIIGAEALLRWKHPEFGNVSPMEFIPVAEENGMILPIGEWVLRTAVSQAKKWMAEGAEPIIMAVNLSAVQFRHLSLPDTVTRILEEYALPPEYLELELTEGVAMYDPQKAINVMNDLHDRGVRMSIDDFGTGYSSLSYLKKFKIYKLKIDQSFIRDINIDNEDKAIVSAIISMAKRLGLKTIAEGVETITQLEYLRGQECDEIQGYYYSKPLPAKEFEVFRNSRGVRAL